MTWWPMWMEHVDSAMVINTLVLQSKPLVELFIHDECDNPSYQVTKVGCVNVPFRIPFFSGNVRFRLLFAKKWCFQSFNEGFWMHGGPHLEKPTYPKSQPPTDFGDVASSHGQLANSWRCLQLDPEVTRKRSFNDILQELVILELHGVTISASDLTDVRTCHSLWGILKHFIDCIDYVYIYIYTHLSEGYSALSVKPLFRKVCDGGISK